MPFLKYNHTWADGLTDDVIELVCLRGKLRSDQGGLGPYRHFKNFSVMGWPDMGWHSWKMARVKAFYEFNTNVWWGCASAGKTYDAAHLAMVYYACDPENTSVIITSTTAKSIRQRIWPSIQEMYHGFKAVPRSPQFGKGFWGNLVDSKLVLQATKGDDKHGIFAIAVREGPVSKAVANIQGIHSKRMLVILDEATDAPDAILEALPNLRTACQEFKLIVIGNPLRYTDPLGMCGEPMLGYSSISVEDEEWPTKGVPKWQVEPGICLHFDGTKSPNIKLGETKYPYLFKQSDLNNYTRTPEGTQTIAFWKYARGFPAPEGVCNTIFSEPLIERYEGRGKFASFYSISKTLAGLDPSFSADGDGCILKFGKMGDFDSQRLGLEVTESIKIPLKTGRDVGYQIAEYTIAACQKRGLKPADLGIDVGGSGSVVADIIEREWGMGINRVDSRSRASDRPVSDHDNRPASEVYQNKGTELWFAAREVLIFGQLRGLDAETVRDWTSRTWEQRGTKIRLQDKEEYKKVLGHSPDDGDACSILVDTAIKSGLRPHDVASYQTTTQESSWLQLAKRYSNVTDNEDDDYAPLETNAA